MIFDFSFILVAATLLTGLIWGIDSLLFKKNRLATAAAKGVAPENIREPLLVEYDRERVRAPRNSVVVSGPATDGTTAQAARSSA